jgi:hypothetical protein
MDNISTYSNAKIVWVLFEDYFNKISVVISHNYATNNLVDVINVNLTDSLGKDISFIDLKHLIADVGSCAATRG